MVIKRTRAQKRKVTNQYIKDDDEFTSRNMLTITLHNIEETVHNIWWRYGRSVRHLASEFETPEVPTDYDDRYWRT